jgi:hypothetical protein
MDFIMRRKNERNPTSLSECTQFVKLISMPMDL